MARYSSHQQFVLMFSYNYTACGGGISRLCREIVTAWRAQGQRVDVLYRQNPHEDGGNTVYSTSETCLRADSPWRDISALWAMRKMRCASAVICRLWYPEGFLALLALMKPIVILAHGSEFTPSQSVWRRGLRKWLMRVVCERANLIIANSSYTHELVLSGAPRAKVVTLPLGVDHKQFSPHGREEARRKLGLEGKTVISSVARLRAFKGHDTVLKAIAGLPVIERERLVYLIAGRGPHKSELQREAERLEVTGNIRWMGFVSEEALPDVYRASDLFVLCTREAPQRQEVEGFGLVFLEAQACGVPVVGTLSGGISEAVREGEGGWLINSDDAGSLTQILSDLIQDPERFRAAGLAARRRIERECTWQQYVERFISFLRAGGITIS